MNALRKIDCVITYVEEVEAASAYYREVFGLRPLWRDERSIGMGFPDTDAEIVLHSDRGIPHRVEVHYLVDHVDSAVEHYARRGCRVAVAPFDIPIGRCAVIEDPFSIVLCVLDMSKGPRQSLDGDKVQ